MYDFIYENENKFKQLEQGLKKFKKDIYKKLILGIYPLLKKGNFDLANKNCDLYEIEFRIDKIYERVYSSKFKLIFKIIDNKIKLIDLLPNEIFLASYNDKTAIYKGVIIPTERLNHYLNKIYLINIFYNS